MKHAGSVVGGVWALGHAASVVVAHKLSDCGSQALELVGFSSCGLQDQLLRSMWNLLRSGIKPVLMCPAPAGRFLSTVLPGKSCRVSLGGELALSGHKLLNQ